MIELHARVSGSGPPVLLLHGLFGSLENLGVVARHLALHHEVHALDLRNHGRSPHAEPMTYEVMAGDVLHYMNRRGLASASLLGHSMGGKVAMTLALRQSERVEHLVVADIAPVSYNAHHDAIFAGLTGLNLDVLQSRQEADTHLEHFVPEPAVRSFLLKNLVKSGADRFHWRLNLHAITRHYHAILQGQHAEHPYTGPVLFLKGGLSDYIRPAYQAHTLALFPAAQLRIIPATGHWLHAEKPLLFSRLVQRFLNPPVSP